MNVTQSIATPVGNYKFFGIPVTTAGQLTGMVSTGDGTYFSCPSAEVLAVSRINYLYTISSSTGASLATINASLGPLTCCQSNYCNSYSSKCNQ